MRLRQSYSRSFTAHTALGVLIGTSITQSVPAQEFIARWMFALTPEPSDSVAAAKIQPDAFYDWSVANVCRRLVTRTNTDLLILQFRYENVLRDRDAGMGFHPPEWTAHYFDSFRRLQKCFTSSLPGE